MKKPATKEAIDMVMTERAGCTGVNVDRVIRELARIAFVKPTDVINPDSATIKADTKEDGLAAVATVKVKAVTGDFDSNEREVKLYDKTKALELGSKSPCPIYMTS